MAIDLDKVKAAAEALGKLNGHERDFLKTYLVMSGRRGSAEIVEAKRGRSSRSAKIKTEPRGPDRRGRYRCSLCEKILPTKRGRGIHMKMHDKETAPVTAPSAP